MKTLVTILSMVLILGCGVESMDQETLGDENSEASADSEAGVYYYSDDEYDSDVTVAGYISPINISVNEVPYRDSEDFYTQELERLEREVKTEYPDHKLTFDAAVGLRNFKAGMYVFLVASSEYGIASESYVDSSGKFEFRFYDDVIDKKSLYTLRASKRIELRLTDGDDIITWCYNMYAEKEMALEDNPVILRHFYTSITKYQCSSDDNQGIEIPEQDDFYTDTVDHSVFADDK